MDRYTDDQSVLFAARDHVVARLKRLQRDFVKVAPDEVAQFPRQLLPQLDQDEKHQLLLGTGT